MNIISQPERIRRHIAAHRLDRMFSAPGELDFQLRIYESGESVLREGDEPDGLYFQVAGRTKVSSSVETGKALLLRFCHPLSIFGDIEFLQKVVVQSEVEVVRTAEFLFVDNRTAEAALMKDPVFMKELLRHLAYKLQTCTTASRINLLASVEERLAGYLLTTRSGNDFGKELNTQSAHEIASLIGTTPRHLNRVVTKLAGLDILRKARNRIVVTDWDRLDAFSNGLRYE